MCANGIQKRALIVLMVLSLTIKCFNQNSFVFKSTANMVHHGLDHGITVNQNTSPLTSRLCDETTRGGHIWNSLGITRFNF